ncbi:hypothetical protein BH20CHL7_BH20CHL7_03440 [soil metagenome]
MRYAIYGVTLATEYPLAVTLPESDATADLTFAVQPDAPDALDLAAHTPVYTEGLRRDGRPSFEFWALPDRDVIRITAAMDFHCWPDRIVCHIVDPEHRYLVEVALFGMVLSLWLERRGTPTLHASSAAIDGQAVAFLASAGTGKTSTAAACVAAGHPLLSDDLIAVAERDGVMFAQPGYPQFRMWPAQAQHFFGSVDEHPIIRPDREKRRITIGDGIGRFVTGPVPLARFYLPRRTGDPGAEVRITPLRPADAMMALLQHSFLTREVIRFGLQGQRLPFLARLIGSVPVCHLDVPEGLDQLPRVVAALEADVADVSRTGRPAVR